MEEASSVEASRKWLEALAKGVISQELEAKSLEGLQVIQARQGYVLCNFLVPPTLSVSSLFSLYILTKITVFMMDS